MSKELMVGANIYFKKNGVEISQAGTAFVDVIGNNFVAGTQHIGTADEELSFSNMDGEGGYLFLKNVGTPNNILIGISTGDYFANLLPGEFTLFRIYTKIMYAKAIGGYSNLLKILIEE